MLGVLITLNLSVLSDLLQLFPSEKRIFSHFCQKYCNFANFWSWALKFLQESDLVLIPSNPRSFYHLMIFGTPSGHSSENLRDFLVQKIISFLDQKILEISRTMTRGGTKIHRIKKLPGFEGIRTRSDSC